MVASKYCNGLSVSISLVLEKLKYHVSRFILNSSVILQLRGARTVGTSPNGNLKYRLNVETPLGARGSILQISPDHVLNYNISRHGVYESNESLLLALELLKIEGVRNFVDLGANCGLVSIQIFHKVPNVNLILVEPVPSTLEALESNLEGFSITQFTIFPFALGESDGGSYIFIPTGRHGSASLRREFIGEFDYSKELVPTKSAKKFCNEVLQVRSGQFVLKCDLEEMDIDVLSEFSSVFWLRTQAVLIELNTSKSQKDRIESLLIKWGENGLNFLCWSREPETRLSISQIIDFALTDVAATKNLFVRRLRTGEKVIETFTIHKGEKNALAV